MKNTEKGNVTAILAQKEISNSKWSNDAINLVNMSYGVNNDPANMDKIYVLTFRNKNKKYKFVVEYDVYKKYKINSLCNIEFDGKSLLHIEFIKIATKNDLNLLK